MQTGNKNTAFVPDAKQKMYGNAASVPILQYVLLHFPSRRLAYYIKGYFTNRWQPNVLWFQPLSFARYELVYTYTSMCTVHHALYLTI
jgi:hypothetical protein